MLVMSDWALTQHSSIASQQADLVVLLGTRLSEIASQDYTLLGVPDPAQQIIHIHPGVEELGKVYKPTLGIQASPIDFCRALQPPARTARDLQHQPQLIGRTLSI